MPPNATSATDEEAEERLKAALWYSLGQFTDEELLRQNRNATPHFIGALTELVWTHIQNTARDLEMFAKHGNRSTVTAADVLLLARRNEGLETLLQGFVDELRAERAGVTERGRGGKKRNG